jgi:hypothetical protein
VQHAQHLCSPQDLASKDGKVSLEAGSFVCMRRANDISDTKGYTPAPEAGKHDDPVFGTHHARDAHHLFQTIGEKLNLFSSTIKLNTQYMHTLWFDLHLKHDTSLEEVKAALRNNPRVATTTKRSVNQIFSFGATTATTAASCRRPWSRRPRSPCRIPARSSASLHPRRTATRSRLPSPQRCATSMPRSSTNVSRSAAVMFREI